MSDILCVTKLITLKNKSFFTCSEVITLFYLSFTELVLRYFFFLSLTRLAMKASNYSRKQTGGVGENSQ